MGLSRRTTTMKQQHHSLTHNLSLDDSDDDHDHEPMNHSRPAANPRNCSCLNGGVFIKVCVVLLLTATAAIQSYSVLFLYFSSTMSSARSSVVLVDHQPDHDSNHATLSIPPPHLPGHSTNVLEPRSKIEELNQASEATAATIITTTTMPTTMIPRRLIFTHKNNLLEPEQKSSMHEIRFHQNILNTIEKYQSAWKAIDEADDKSNNTTITTASSSNSNGKVQVWFLDNNDCEGAIQRVEPELVDHFRAEMRGDYKADICRIAALYLHGGYYFDVDMRVIQPIILENRGGEGRKGITFSTAIMHARDGFFQSFLASTASNEILKVSLQIMLDWYKNKTILREIGKLISEDEPSGRDNIIIGDSVHEERRNSRIYEVSNLHGIDPAVWVINRRGLIGPVSLKFAYERVLLINNNSSNSSSFEASSLATIGGNQRTFILQEDDLSANPTRELFPDLVRQEGDGCCCNYVVHGPPPSFRNSASAEGQNTGNTTITPYFFSRIVGAGEYCHWKGGVVAWVRPRQQPKQSLKYTLFKPF